ncbi:hypothetical protein GGI43DRAFT_427609 [Trichoderma evansii]
MYTLVPETTIAGVTVVDTPIVQAAQKYARYHLNDMGFNHVMHSWIFSVVVYKRLHEVAVSRIDLEDKRFEVDGAEAACDWIKEEQQSGRIEHWDDHRLRLVWDAIALHTTPTIALYKEQIIKICSLGIAADFRGPDLDTNGTISEEVFDAVNKRFPRLDLANGIREIFCGFCQTKPRLSWKPHMMKFGKRYVKGYKAEGSLMLDVIQATAK